MGFFKFLYSRKKKRYDDNTSVTMGNENNEGLGICKMKTLVFTKLLCSQIKHNFNHNKRIISNIVVFKCYENGVEYVDRSRIL